MKSTIKILLVEDDPNLGSLLSDYLRAKGFETKLATDGEKGLKIFNLQSYDFLILDVMMPKKDGFTLAKEIRQINKQVPILFLTAKSMSEDTLEGFKAGADDYMTKPFSMDELLVRINAILRRTSSIPELGDETKTYTIGKYEFDYNKQKLVSPDTDTKLTTKENELLYLLCKNKNGVLERNHALNMIWGDDNYFNGRSMDVYIAKLRKHLKADEKIQILNVHGRGFKLLDE
ncbi:MAG TPA: DNA-binding response regulator [Flavobacteriales bacterium]|jgi:DNA-binding response OmpR family regulator|nr:DNA-binding response regulator [Flavobacteriales bacterium]|tara:strand:- start:8724 stop:9419 length:696 start_codon:yes stop_codon:yes gene_type:complete